MKLLGKWTIVIEISLKRGFNVSVQCRSLLRKPDTPWLGCAAIVVSLEDHREQLFLIEVLRCARTFNDESFYAPPADQRAITSS